MQDSKEPDPVLKDNVNGSGLNVLGSFCDKGPEVVKRLISGDGAVHRD